MLGRLLNKWFGLESDYCKTCEVLRIQLEESNQERRDLLRRLLYKEPAEPLPQKEVELTPITPQFVPWRVRQQMLEVEDAKKAELLKEKKKEIDGLRKKNIDELEKELLTFEEEKVV